MSFAKEVIGEAVGSTVRQGGAVGAMLVGGTVAGPVGMLGALALYYFGLSSMAEPDDPEQKPSDD